MQIVKCKHCTATGHVPLPLGGGNEANSQCPVCKGRKNLVIPDGKQLCPVCKGLKKVPVKAAGLTYTEPCKTCNETGFVDA